MEILIVMPDYVYYIIGAGLAVLVMLLIIAVSGKPSKKTKNNCEVKEENEPKEQDVVEEKTEDNVVKEEKEETHPQEKETVNEELKEEQKEEKVEEQPKEEPVKEEPTEKAEEKEMSKKEKLNRYRVTYDKEQGNWVVKMDGADRASRRCATKEEALKIAKELAEKKDASLSVHKKDGKFQKKANIK